MNCYDSISIVGIESKNRNKMKIYYLLLGNEISLTIISRVGTYVKRNNFIQHIYFFDFSTQKAEEKTYIFA